MNQFISTNKSLWNVWTKLHLNSEFYAVDSFKKGGTTLKHVELEEMPDVNGKSLLHLQCHFGLDSLSWARRGARVTGVDLSDEAIKTANTLARELDLDARFLCCDVLKLDEHLRDQFDLVFTSYGVIGWLGDLKRWAEHIAQALKPGGSFYMVEFHPMAYMFREDGKGLAYSYFFEPTPSRFVEQGSYAAPDSDFTHECYYWCHHLGEVVSALLGAGLRLEFLHEFPYSTHNCMAFMEPSSNEPDKFVMKKGLISDQGEHGEVKIPLMFSIKANKA